MAESNNSSEAITLANLADIFDGRAANYDFLARLYRTEVDEEFLTVLLDTNYPAESGNELMDKGHYQIPKYLSNEWVDTINKLAVDYTRTFLGSGIDTYSAAYPFESVYTSEKRLLMGDAREEVLTIYKSCGLEKSEKWTVGEDHIAVELEFMRVLSVRAAKALREGKEDKAYSLITTQYNFLTDHLTSWVGVFTNEMRRFTETLFYEGVANLTDGFLAEDEALLADLLSE